MRHSPLFLVVFLVFLALSAGCSKNEEPGKLKVGLIASLTGPAAPQGQAWLNGALLAAKHLEESGKSIQIVVEDDRTAATPAISAFNKLAKIDQVAAIVGGTWDFLAEAVYPLASHSRIPFLTPSNPPEIFSDEAKHNPFVFTNSVTIAAEKEALKRFLIVKEAKSLGLLSSAIPWGIVHARMFREIASELQLPIVLDQEFSFRDGKNYKFRNMIRIHLKNYHILAQF